MQQVGRGILLTDTRGRAAMGGLIQDSKDAKVRS